MANQTDNNDDDVASKLPRGSGVPSPKPSQRVIRGDQAVECCQQQTKEVQRIIQQYAVVLIQSIVDGEAIHLVSEKLPVNIRENVAVGVGQKVVENRLGVGEQLEIFKKAVLRGLVPTAGLFDRDPDYSPSDPSFDIPFVDDPDIPGPR